MDLSRPARLADFAAEVGTAGPVTVVGGRTGWDLGGFVDPTAREVRAPAGIVDFDPAEMTVRVGAGTEVASLAAALADKGQFAALPDRVGSTVGGALAVGFSGLDRLGVGSIRETLLEARCVSADGRLVKVGGPMVKNVSGFDLCRLLVGSLGTLALLGEVVLRTWPLPPVSGWWAGPADPFVLRDQLYWPWSVLWDGTTTWVRLAGHGADVDAEAAMLERRGLDPVDGPPPLPAHRESLPPASLRALTGTFVAEVGVGVVHRDQPGPPPMLSAPIADLHRRIKAAYDPTGRLNPGRAPRGATPGALPT